MSPVSTGLDFGPLSSSRPQDVGILAAEVYFPRNYISQKDYENFCGCPGKFTEGLGQDNMAYVDDQEDIGSVFTTALNNLLSTYEIDPKCIGRLEVGTETLHDKSKSIKTCLMKLFQRKVNDSGVGASSLSAPTAATGRGVNAGTGDDNFDVEGVTSINACYGGTAALLNCVSWVESSGWDGRYAVMICGDIALYEDGPARATSGCGAVALLIGPDAPLVLNPYRASHCMDIYDFYKPASSNASEYPIVFGKMSQNAYLKSVDECYMKLQQKLESARQREEQRQRQEGKIDTTGAAAATITGPTQEKTPIRPWSWDYFCFHSPYHKLAQKGLSRLFFIDCLLNLHDPFYKSKEDIKNTVASITKDISIDFTSTESFSIAQYGTDKLSGILNNALEDRSVDKIFRNISFNAYKDKLLPTSLLNKELGNCYSASIFMSLVGLIFNVQNDLVNKNIFMFSYGSGSMATIYTLSGRLPTNSTSNTNYNKTNVAAMDNMEKNIMKKAFPTIVPYNTWNAKSCLEKRFTLEEIAQKLNLTNRLRARTLKSPTDFNHAMKLREDFCGKSNIVPIGGAEMLFPNTYYLKRIGENYQREYDIYQPLEIKRNSQEMVNSIVTMNNECQIQVTED